MTRRRAIVRTPFLDDAAFGVAIAGGTNGAGASWEL